MDWDYISYITGTQLRLERSLNETEKKSIKIKQKLLSMIVFAVGNYQNLEYAKDVKLL